MPAARKRRFWNPKLVPNEPFEINWAHPLNTGLINFWPLNGTLNDIVRGLSVAKNAHGIFALGATGPAYHHDGTTNAGGAASVAPFSGTGELTAFFQFATSTSGTGNSAFSWGNSGTNGQYITVDVESGVLYSRHIGGILAYAGSGFDDGNVHSFGWTKTAGTDVTGVSIYGDGAALAMTYGGTGTVLNLGTGSPFQLGFDYNAGFNGNLSGIRLYNRHLSAGEMEWLAAEPWSVVQRLPRRSYSLPPSSSAALSGASDAVGTFGGSLALALALSGDIAGSATDQGTVGIANSLSGDIAADASEAGTLGNALALAGDIAADATDSGTLANSLALSGEIAASAQETANLANAIGLAGLIGADGAISALVANAIYLGGTDGAVSSWSASFSAPSAHLYGTIGAGASLTGTLANAVGIAGQVGAQASTRGILGLGVGLTGSVLAAVSANGILSGSASIALSGAIGAGASLTGILANAVGLTGEIGAQAGASAVLGLGIGLTGSMLAAVATDGSLSVAIALEGASDASATYTGTIASVAGALTGVQGSSAFFGGGISVESALVGSISSAGSFAASFAARFIGTVRLELAARQERIVGDNPSRRLVGESASRRVSAESIDRRIVVSSTQSVRIR